MAANAPQPPPTPASTRSAAASSVLVPQTPVSRTGTVVGTMAASVGTLKLTTISLEKDVWENVAPIIQKTFHGICANLGSVKRWADRQEERAKKQEDAHAALEVRVDELEVGAKATQERLDELSQEINRVAEDSKQQIELLTSCLSSVVVTVRAIFANMGKALGAELPEGPDVEEALERVRAGENAGEVLQVLCADLEHLIEALESSFKTSEEWRSMQDQRYAEMGEQLKDLFAAAEATRERLLTWREHIKENAHVISSMGSSLSDTQADVRELQAAQVRRHDVEEAVDRRAAELTEQIGQAEAHSEEIATRMEEHVAEVESHIEEVRRLTNEQMENHGSQVTQLLQQSLNPINAYLNTMHVKADVVRVELDSLNDKVPKLATSIEELGCELRKCDEAGCSRSEELSKRQDKLVLSLAQLGEQSQTAQSELSRDIAAQSEELGGRIAEVRSSLEGTAEALESAKKGELAKVAKDLATLEQKVAKWVHAHPLPAKVSEARLFSLEAKLAEEMDARFHLEQHVKSARGSYSARDSSVSVALPQLPRQQSALKKWGS